MTSPRVTLPKGLEEAGWSFSSSDGIKGNKDALIQVFLAALKDAEWLRANQPFLQNLISYVKEMPNGSLMECTDRLAGPIKALLERNSLSSEIILPLQDLRAHFIKMQVEEELKTIELHQGIIVASFRKARIVDSEIGMKLCLEWIQNRFSGLFTIEKGKFIHWNLNRKYDIDLMILIPFLTELSISPYVSHQLNLSYFFIFHTPAQFLTEFLKMLSKQVQILSLQDLVQVQSQKGVGATVQLVQVFENLSSLSLDSFPTFSPNFLPSLLQYPEKCVHLRLESVSIVSNELFNQLKKLETLRLKSCKLPESFFLKYSFPMLRTIELEDMELSSDELLKLGNDAQELRTVSLRRLSGIDYGGLNRFTLVKEICIDSCLGLNERGIILYLHSASQLTHLNIKVECLTEAFLQALLARASALKYLRLAATKIECTSSQLCGFFTKCTTLVSLHLEGVASFELALFSALKEMQQLKEIRFTQCSDIKDAHIEAMAHDKWEKIEIDDASLLSNVSLGHIAMQGKALQELTIPKGVFTYDGVMILLIRCTQLVHLRIPHITVEWDTVCSENFTKGRLRTFDISESSNLTIATLARLKTQFPTHIRFIWKPSIPLGNIGELSQEELWLIYEEIQQALETTHLITCLCTILNRFNDLNRKTITKFLFYALKAPTKYLERRCKEEVKKNFKNVEFLGEQEFAISIGKSQEVDIDFLEELKRLHTLKIKLTINCKDGLWKQSLLKVSKLGSSIQEIILEEIKDPEDLIVTYNNLPERLTPISLEIRQSKIDSQDILLNILALFPGISKLNVSSSALIDDSSLLKVGENFRGLNGIVLDGCTTISEKGLGSLFSRTSKLSEISFAFCNLSTEFVVQVDEYWGQIEIFNLRGFNIAGDNLRELLSRANNIKEVCFSATSLKDEHLKAVYGYYLTKIDLSNCLLFTENGLIELLKRSENIEDFNVSNCFQLSDRVLDALPKKIQRLNLSNSYEGSITDDGLARYFQNNRKLTYINLCGRRSLTDNTFLQLAYHGAQLKEINLQGCFNCSPQAVSKILLWCTSLEILDLTGCIYITQDLVTNWSKQYPQVHIIFDSISENVQERKVPIYYGEGNLPKKSSSMTCLQTPSD